MKILVIGATGYLGGKVVKRLFDEGHSIVCTRRPSSRDSAINTLPKGISWIEATRTVISTVLKSEQFDCVVNMACNYGKGGSQEEVIEANLDFPLYVLVTAIKNDVKHYLTIGTGLPNSFNLYSFSKNQLSEFGKFYADKGCIDFYELKLEMFYGSDEPRDRFLPNVIIKMLKGEVVDTTQGTQRRDLVAIDDVVEAVMLVMEALPTGYHVVPIGTGYAPSISEVIDYIWDQTDQKSQINKGAIPMRKDEPDCFADISVIKAIGNWEPCEWKVGLANMIEEMKQKYMENKT